MMHPREMSELSFSEAELEYLDPEQLRAAGFRWLANRLEAAQDASRGDQ